MGVMDSQADVAQCLPNALNYHLSNHSCSM